MFRLDTNVISGLRKVGDGKADPHVMAWLTDLDASKTCISALTLLELEIGILRLARRDPAQTARLRLWFDTRVLPEFAGRCLLIDAAVALRCARLHVPDPGSERDGLIAATALVHGKVVVTRNVADFAMMGVPLPDPWQARS